MPGQQLPPGIFRIALGVEYVGTRYSGWQKMPPCTATGKAMRTVQGELEQALSKIAAASVLLTCAGRTDAGVHATGQVVHFDTAAERPEKAWVLGGNAHLPASIRIQWARPVAPQFHARFSARMRTYRYLIANTPAQPAITNGQCLWAREPLDIQTMQQAAQFCIGEHDFSSVRGSHCQAKNPVRTLHRFSVTNNNGWIVIEICGNAFLQHMVRNLMGLLLPVGRGERPPTWVRDVLAARDRKQAGKTEYAGALYLVRVEYGEEHRLPIRAKGPFMLADEIDAQCAGD